MNSDFWRSKRVLITGQTGFKGGWLSLWLQRWGAIVTGVAGEPPSRPSFYEQACVANGMQDHRFDIRDGHRLKGLFRQNEPEFVFHLAAQALVRNAYSSPVETYDTNVMGTLHVLEAIRATPSVRAAIIVTSDKCYENQEWEWGYRENEPLGGSDPYSSSKGCVEILVASYRRSYFQDTSTGKLSPAVASVRAGNVVGGGDRAADRLLPDFIRAIEQNSPLSIRYPSAVRPWQHVLEPLGGYITLAERLYEDGTSFAEAWNFGPRDEDMKTVRWVVECLARAWGRTVDIAASNDQHPRESQILKLDCSKAHSRLRWWPRWSLETALHKVAEWHRAEAAGLDLRQMSVDQIDEYTSV